MWLYPEFHRKFTDFVEFADNLDQAMGELVNYTSLKIRSIIPKIQG